MAFRAACPSCGAPVEFQSAASFHAVCGFCRSTLVRHGGDLENLGRMAELVADASPIQLGTEGVYNGVHFAVIGRIQLRYAAGVWNEWHVLFDDMRGGWLSDAGGEYTMSFLTPPGAALPAHETLAVDAALSLAGREWRVSNKEEAFCIAGEGELPFAFGAGYAAPVADLRATDESGAFATIDWSETPPLFFVGQSRPFADFRFANLRESATAQAAGPVKSLQCPSCGGPIAIHDKAVQSVACPACLTVLDAANDSLRILQRVSEALSVTPRLPLGSVGRFEDKDWTVIGFQRRDVTVEGIAYPWDEYLLHHPTEGFRWLVDSKGHWTWVRTLASPPRYTEGLPVATHQKESFTRYSAGLAVTRYVVGEFTWKVQVGEEWETVDFVAPPRMLSREKNGSEVGWSLGDYLAPEAVAAAFGLKQALPAPRGVGACQPNPRVEPHRRVCRRFWQFALLATLMQILWAIFGGSTLVEQRVVYSPHKDDSVVTPSFRLDEPVRTLALRHNTDLDNNWIGLNLTLVEKTSGKAWIAGTELSYWHGVDDGESWSEGDKERELLFRDLPAGDYYFVIDPELSDENPRAVADTLRVVRNPAAWSNYVLVMIFLLAFPLFTRYRQAAFETERWADADFAADGTVPAVSSDDDGGDD